MRSAGSERFAALALVLAGCGATPAPPAHEPAVELAAAPLPEIAARYEVVHRVRASFAGDEVAVLRARLYVTVIDRRSDEADLAIVAQLLADDHSVAATDELRATLRADGTLAGGARSRCVDGAFDDLVSTRLVDATLGSRPSREDRTGIVRTELDEAEARTTFARGEEPGSLRGEVTLTLRAGAIAGEVYRGPVSVVARHALDGADLLAGRSRTILRGEVMAARGVRGALEVVSDTEVRPYVGPEVATASCHAGFDGATMIATLGARQHALRACYEAALATDPTLTGRLVFQLVLQPSGDATLVTRTEGPTDQPALWDEVSACVIDVLAAIRLAEGPPDPTTVVVPFRFVPDE